MWRITVCGWVRRTVKGEAFTPRRVDQVGRFSRDHDRSRVGVGSSDDRVTNGRAAPLRAIPLDQRPPETRRIAPVV